MSDVGNPQKATVTVGDRTAELPILTGTVRNVSADALRDEQSGHSYFSAEIAVPRDQIAQMVLRDKVQAEIRRLTAAATVEKVNGIDPALLDEGREALAAACFFSSAPFASAWVIHSIMVGNVPYLLLIMCMLKSSSFNIFSYRTSFNGKF